jgi:large subunit ribosomal protein L10
MGKAKSIVFVDFRGVSVADDTRLRKTCRDNKVDYKVIKNTLANRAVTDLGWHDLAEMFHGPTAMVLSELDPVAAAKVLQGFARDIPALHVKGGVLEGGEVLTADRVAYLGTLPSRDQLLARLAGSFNSPVTSLVMVLNATLTGFARAVNALREKKEQAAD